MISDVVEEAEEQPTPVPLRRKSSTDISKRDQYLAFSLAIGSSISIVIMQFFLKKVTKNLNPNMVLGVRGSLLFIFNLIYLTWTNQSIHKKDPDTFMALIKRSVAGSITLTLYLGSVKYIPVGIANALFNTMPIMSFFIEAIYYKKAKVRFINLAITVVSFIGVLLIIQPPFLFGGLAPDNYLFYFIVLSSALTGSFSMLFLHQLKGKCNELVTLQHNYFFQATTSYIIYLFFNSGDRSQIQYIHSITFIQSIKLVIYMLCIVLFAFGTQFLQTKAMFICSSPALVLPFSYVSVIFGLLLDVLIFDAVYNGLMIVGMIMASAGLFTKFILLHITPQQNKNTNANANK